VAIDYILSDEVYHEGVEKVSVLIDVMEKKR